MKKFGVMEIFYGAPWSDDLRLRSARWLAETGMGFYFYGPKADECLRKNWQLKPDADQLARYRQIRDTFVSHDIRFGMILSPHGLDQAFDLAARRKLEEKVKALDGLGLDYFGLFFDDMKSAENLAERQLEIASLVEKSTRARLVFCPSFYSNDPMLDMLFGDRPARYLETIGDGLSANAEILWTGEQIISPEFTTEHLTTVANLLKRKPFVCDNFFADDGPMFCNFLRLQPPTGRPREVFNQTTHWAINPMNQAHLSRLILRGFMNYVTGSQSAESAYSEGLRTLLTPPLVEFVLKHGTRFTTEGLESLTADEKASLLAQLKSSAADPSAAEIMKWIEGHYAVDFTVMLEQSCFMG